MGKHQPLFASEKTAAGLLDMPASDFRRLVEKGALPPPRRIGQFERWDTEELRRIINGESDHDNEFVP